MTVVLVDYGAGNLRSAENALRAAGADAVDVTCEPEAVRAAERIVLPGVGAFGQCIGAIRAIAGLEEALREAVLERGRPFLGICVGMQLLAATGHEFGTHAGLGWIAGEVRRMEPADPACRIPQIGWNEVQGIDLLERGWAYFVHSYAFRPADRAAVVATIDHGGEVVAAVQAGPILGVQFHPEKSQRYGLALLGRFLAWKP
ncbi:MAG: imidazole glycerol phosphate synthase subunit HisH [Sphingomonadaceae bacterium]